MGFSGFRGLSGEQGLDFRRGNETVLPGLEPRQIEASEGDPRQLQNEIPERIEESANFPVPAFREGDPVPCVGLSYPLEFQFDRLHGPSIQTDLARTEPFEVRFGHDALDLGEIGSPYCEAGVEESLGQVAVVGQEQSSFGLKVQPSDVNQRSDGRKKLA
jgi:hypothetical protein